MSGLPIEITVLSVDAKQVNEIRGATLKFHESEHQEHEQKGAQIRNGGKRSAKQEADKNKPTWLVYLGSTSGVPKRNSSSGKPGPMKNKGLKVDSASDKNLKTSVEDLMNKTAKKDATVGAVLKEFLDKLNELHSK